MSSYLTRSYTSLCVTKLSLNKQHVPSDPANLTTKNEKAIQKAIFAFHRLSDDAKIINDIRERGDKILQPLMTEDLYNKFWDDGLFDWSLYLFNHYNESPDKRWEVISYVSCVLSHFTDIGGTFIITQMYEENYLSLAERLWAERQHDYQRSEYSSTHGWWGPFLYFIIRCQPEESIDIPGGKAKELLMIAFKNGATIMLLLERLLARFSVGNSSDEEYYLFTSALSELVPFYNEPQPRVVRKLAQIIEYILTEILPMQFSAHVLRRCYMLICLLTFHLRNANSIYTFRVAIKSRIFQIVAMFSKHFDCIVEEYGYAPHEVDHTLQQAILDVLTKIAPQYMYYPTIQRVLHAAVYNDDYIDDVRGTRAEEKWKIFRHRFEDAVYVTRESTFPIVSLCDNVMHGLTRRYVPPIRRLYRECSGCESSWYCSDYCQRTHWNNGHRNKCAQMHKPPAYPFPFKQLFLRDYVTVLRFAIRAAGYGWDKACKDALSKKQLPTQISVVIDYTKYPEKVSLAERNEAAIQAAAAMPNTTVVQCRVPLGPYVATLTAAGDIENWDKTLWFGGRSLTTYDYVPMESNQKFNWWEDLDC